jgi:hypothetical protein
VACSRCHALERPNQFLSTFALMWVSAVQVWDVSSKRWIRSETLANATVGGQDFLTLDDADLRTIKQVLIPQACFRTLLMLLHISASTRLRAGLCSKYVRLWRV